MENINDLHLPITGGLHTPLCDQGVPSNKLLLLCILPIWYWLLTIFDWILPMWYCILDISPHSARCILCIANHGQTSGTAIKVSRATNWSSGNMCTKPRCKFWMLWTKWESGACGQISTSINLHSDLQTLFSGRRCGWRWNIVYCSCLLFGQKSK